MSISVETLALAKKYTDESGGGGGGGGTSNYNQLSNLPQINGVTITGNKSAADLSLASSSDIPEAATAAPSDLGTAAVGSSTKYAKEDHVHKMPTASDIGAGTYSKPSGGIPASDLASGVIPTIPSAYSSEPEMDGTASAGSSTSWAKGDHVHPSDTSKADKTSYVTVTGTSVTQTGTDNTMYLCGELTDLTFTAPVSGICAVRFTSGTTPTVVVLTGVTMPDGWAGAEASTVYEINILDGYGLVAKWSVSGS